MSISVSFVFDVPINASKVSTLRLTLSVDIFILAVFVAIVSSFVLVDVCNVIKALSNTFICPSVFNKTGFNFEGLSLVFPNRNLELILYIIII